MVYYNGKKMLASVVMVGSGGGEVKLQEKNITENGTYTPDAGFDGFSKVSVNVESGGGEKPTLFAPYITLNSVSSELTITDNRNGDFEVLYDLYAGDNKLTTLSSKTATLTDYMEHTETIEIKVQAVCTNFNSSEFSTVEWKHVNVNGTVGLAYELSSDGTYAICTGIGTATETDIEIASEYDGVPVTEIGKNAFYNNDNLTSVVIPDSVTNIGEWAFRRAPNLASVVLSNSTKAIGRQAFQGCTSLVSIFIPKSITVFSHYAFLDCTALKRVDFSTHLVVPTLSSTDTFGNAHTDLQIKVLANLIDEWKAKTNWAEYADKIVTEFTNEV